MPEHKLPPDAERPSQANKDAAKRPDAPKKSVHEETGLEHADLPPPGGDPWHDGP